MNYCWISYSTVNYTPPPKQYELCSVSAIYHDVNFVSYLLTLNINFVDSAYDIWRDISFCLINMNYFEVSYSTTNYFFFAKKFTNYSPFPSTTMNYFSPKNSQTMLHFPHLLRRQLNEKKWFIPYILLFIVFEVF